MAAADNEPIREQHVLTFPMPWTKAKKVVDKLSKLSIKMKLGQSPYDLLGCFVANDTKDPYYYDLWFCRCSVDENYDLQYFWTIREHQRHWIYVGTYPLLYIFWLIEIGYEATWLELWITTFGICKSGWCEIKMRTWLATDVIWTISSMALNYHNIWSAWHKLYLPYGKAPVPGYSAWASNTIQLPSIPTYKPKDVRAQRFLLFGVGYGDEAVSGPFTFYANKIMKLWTNGYDKGDGTENNRTANLWENQIRIANLWGNLVMALLMERDKQADDYLWSCKLFGSAKEFAMYDNYENRIVRKAMAHAIAQERKFCRGDKHLENMYMMKRIMKLWHDGVDPWLA